MANLTANYERQQKGHSASMNVAPANAGDKFYVGSYLFREAATGLATVTIGAGVIPLGIVHEWMPHDNTANPGSALDNTSGADGTIGVDAYARCVRYDQAGEWAFSVTGSPKVGDVAYLQDNNIVGAVDTGGLGIIGGRFTRPSPLAAAYWYVDIGYKNIVS